MKEQEVKTVFKLFSEIAIISQLSTALLDKYLPGDLKSSQFALLSHFIRVGDGSTHAQLARAMQVTKGAMTNTLKRLTTLELVVIKVDSDDARIKRAYMTVKGHEVYQTSIESLNLVMQQVLSEFGIDEVENALPFLGQLRSMLDNNR